MRIPVAAGGHTSTSDGLRQPIALTELTGGLRGHSAPVEVEYRAKRTGRSRLPGARSARECDTGFMFSRRVRGPSRRIGLACLAAGVVLLAGCAAPPLPFSVSPTPTPTATPTASPSPPSTATATATAGVAVCGPNTLALSLQSRPYDSGAGNFFWDLQLTNNSSVECTVEGFPAVSLVSANSGAVIGAVSSEEPGRWFPVAVVPLAPGASAFSLLHLGQAGAYNCTVVPVTELTVTLPDWTDPRQVATPKPIDGCDDTSTTIVRSGPLAPSRVVF
ncbi:uncharacterized protein DUF4232 [Cryobacterium psychrophilum]|nr:uncharacterized protein DUF4232 [Cryobacterium psychrophilum]